MQRFFTLRSNYSAIISKAAFIGMFLFVMLLFPNLVHAQFKSYANSSHSGAITVKEPPDVVYPDSKLLSVNSFVRIAPVFPGYVTPIVNAAIRPALPQGLSINSAGVIEGTTSEIIPSTKFFITVSGGSCGSTTRNITLRTAVGPIITKQPYCADTICSNSNIQSISVEATIGKVGTTLSYQWRKDGVPLQNGYLNGSYISGAQSSRLDIMNPNSSFANARYDAVISDSIVAIESLDTTFKMITPPQIITQPQTPQVLCEYSGTINLSVNATGNNLTYRWRKNNLPVTDGGATSGARTRQLQITNPAVTDTGDYDVVIEESGYCGVISNVIPVKLNFTKIIGSDYIIDTIFCEEQGVKTLSLNVAGTNLVYNWAQRGNYGDYKIRGTEYSGLDSPSLNIANPSVKNEGIYSLSVRSEGCLYSFKQGLIKLVVVKKPVMYGDLVAGSPLYFNAIFNHSKTLVIQAVGRDLKFIWRKNGIPLSDAQLHNRQLYNLITLTQDPIGDGRNNYVSQLEVNRTDDSSTNGNYDVIVKNSNCLSATSRTINIRLVIPPPVIDPVVITQQPVGPAGYNCTSRSITLEVRATGTVLSYQWRRNGVPITSNPIFDVSYDPTKCYIKGSNTTPVSDVEGVYDVIITGVGGDVVSSDQVNVRFIGTPQSLTPQGQNFAFCKKDSNSVTIKASYTNADSLTFRWLVSPTNAPITKSYSSDKVEFTTAISNNLFPGYYTYSISNRCASIGGNVQILFNNESGDSVNARIILPAQVCNNVSLATLTTAALPIQTALTYQWQKDGIDLTANNKYPTVTTRQLQITNPGFADSGNYQLLMKYPQNMGGCMIRSAKSFLKIDSNSRVVTAPVAPPVIFSGNGVQTISVVAQGSNLNYQWYKGSSNNPLTNNSIISGQGTSTLTFTNNISSNTDNYSVRVTGNCLAGSSNIVTNELWFSTKVDVLSNINIITNPSLFGEVCAGNSAANLRVRSSANIIARGGSLSYFWRKDGVVINDQDFGGGHIVSGTRTNQITIDKPNQADSGTYDLVAIQSYYDGNYDRTITESVVTAGTKLIVNPPTTSITYAQINENTFYRWTKNNVPYNQAGTYYNTSNCNLDTLVLTVVLNSLTDTTVTICQGETFRWRVSQLEYAQTGTYRFTLNNVEYILRLMVKSRPNVTLSGSADVCAGSSTTLNITQTNAGIGIASGVLSDGTTFNGFGQSRISIPVSPGSTTTYTISSLTDGVCASLPINISGSAVVNVSTPPTATISSATWNCGALIDSPATIRLTFGGTGPWSGYLTNGNWAQNIYFNSTSNTLDIPISYPGNVLGFSGSTITIGAVWNQQRCYAQPSMLTGSFVIPAKSAITYVNQTQGTSQFRPDANKSQKICSNTAIQSIVYSVSNGDSLMVTGLPTGLMANFRRVYTFNNSNNQSVTVNKALVITGTPTTIGTFRYYVSVPVNFGCGITRDSGVITVLGDNSLTLAATSGSNNQTVYSSGPIDTIKYTTSNTTGATVTGLPYGVDAFWANNQLVISGVSNYIGNYNYTVTLNDACGTNSVKTGTINVVNQYSNSLTLFEGANAGYACKDLPISNLRFASSLPTLNDNNTSVIGLPPGLTASWTADTLTISGTATQTGLFNYQISYTGGYVFKGVINVLKRETLSLFSGASTQIICNQSYLENIVFQNSSGFYAPINQVGLPDGVLQTYDQDKYKIYGYPNQPGVYPYKLYLSSTCGLDSIDGVITMLAPSAPITLTSAVNTDQQKLCLNSAITNITYQSANAVDAFVSGLPQGLTTSWANNIFTISGTPTEFGTFNYQLSMYNSGNCSRVDKTGRITVLENAAVNTTLTDTLYASLNNSNAFYLNYNIFNDPHQVTDTFTSIANGLPGGLSASAHNSFQTSFRDGVVLSGAPNAIGYYNFTVSSNNFCGVPSISGVIRVVEKNTYQLLSANSTTAQKVCKNSSINPVVYNCYFLGADNTTNNRGIITVTGLPAGVTVRGAYTASPITDNERSSNYLGVINEVYKTRYQIFSDIQSPITQVIIEGIPTEGGIFNYTIEDNRNNAVINNSITVGSSELTLASGSQYPASMRPLIINTAPVNVYNIGDSSQVKYLGNPIDPIVFGVGELSITPTLPGMPPNYTIDVWGLPPGLTAAMSIHNYKTDGLPNKSYEITGTPTASGTFYYTITVNGSCGTINYTGTIVVKPNPTITLSSSASTLTQEICSNAAITPVQFNLGNRSNNAIVSGLPTGVTGSFANGVFTLSGNPQQPGTYNYVIKPVDTSWSILDTLLPNVKVALALRKLVKNYNGPAIRLKRPDGVSQDFGFVGTELDTAAINTWAKEMDPAYLSGVQMPWGLFCTKLYDQSANGADYIAPEPTTTESVWNWAAPVFNSDYLYTNIAGVTAILPRLSFATMGSLLNDRIYSAPYTTAVGVQKPNERSVHSTFFTEAGVASGSSVQADLNMGSGLLNNAMVQLPGSLFTGLLVFNKVLSADDREDVNNLLNGYYSKYSTFASGTFPYRATGTITVRSLPQITVESSNTKNCVNDPVTLTASGAQTYLWDNNTTGNVNTVNPQRNTTYTVTGTDAFGCTNVGSIIVHVTSLITNRDTTVCENKSLVLTAASSDFASPEVRYIQVWATYSDSTEQIEDIYSNPPNMLKNAGRMIVGEIQAYKNGVNIARNLPSMSGSSPFTDYSDPQAYLAGDKTFDGDDNTAWISGLTDFMGNSMGEMCCQMGYTPFYFEMDLGAPISLDSIRIFTSNTYNQTFKVYAMLDKYDQSANYYQLGEEVMKKGAFVYDFASAAAPVSYLWSTGETTPQITVNPTQTTTYSCTITGTKTCYDEVVVTVNNCQTVYSSFQVNACESYTLPWGTVVTSSGNYTNTYNNVLGADSVVTANVVINQPVTVNISDSGVDSYLWNGITYRSSGLKYWRGTTINGCDSIVILDLTLTSTCATTYSSDTVFACNSYLWHGVTYTSSNNTATWRTVNAAGCDSIVQLNLTITKVIPARPASITQTLVSNICGQRVYRYAASVTASANGYLWILPSSVGGISGATVDSGDISRSRVIRVKYASNAAAIAGDSIRVSAWSYCGNSSVRAARLINTSILKPTAAPAIITITAVTTNICGNREYRYTAPSLPANATGYVWAFTGVLGANAVIDSGTVNTKAIRVRYTLNNAAANGDSVMLSYSSVCGNGPIKASKLTNTIITAPAAPAGITITPVATTICGARLYRYTAPALPGATATAMAATGYFWSFVGTLGANAVIDSGSLASQIIRVRYSSNSASVSGDSVRLLYTSNCGNGLLKSVKLSNIALNAPAAPTITSTVLVSNVCSGRKVRYSVPTSPAASATAGAATGYLWSFVGTVLGANATIDSGTVNSRVIVVLYTSNAAAVASDSVRCLYTSDCGNSANGRFKIAQTALNAPAAPTAITITAVAPGVCGAKLYRYAAPALPAASATAGAATGWLWSFTGTLGANATIDSGSTTSRVIVVRYTSNAAAGTDSVRVRYNSGCGFGPNRASKLTNVAIAVPAAPTVTVTAITTNVCGARVYRYSASALPAATTTAGAATGWSWSLPEGTVGSTGTLDSGSLSGQTIRISYSSNAAATGNTLNNGTADSIRVRFTSGCGLGTPRATRLTNTVLNPPLAPASVIIALVSNICGARVYRYTAPALPVASSTAGAATGYSWSLPVGAVGSTGTLDSGVLSGAGARSIRIKYTSNVATSSGDSIRVAYTSGCGNGARKSQFLSNALLTCSSTPVVFAKTPPAVSTSLVNVAVHHNPSKGSFNLQGKTAPMVSASLMNIEVYPNPSKGSFNLRVKTVTKHTFRVRIFDVLGREIKSLTGTSDQTVRFGNEFNPGVYMLEVREGENMQTVHVVKL